MIPLRPRRWAISAYSSGSPAACLHSGVCMCDSYRIGGEFKSLVTPVLFQAVRYLRWVDPRAVAGIQQRRRLLEIRRERRELFVQSVHQVVALRCAFRLFPDAGRVERLHAARTAVGAVA